MDPLQPQQLRCNDIDVYILNQISEHRRLRATSLIAPISKLYGIKKSSIYWRIDRLCKMGVVLAEIQKGIPPIKLLTLSKLGTHYLKNTHPPQKTTNLDSGLLLRHKTAALQMIERHEKHNFAPAFQDRGDSNDRWAVEFLEMCHAIIYSECGELKAEKQGQSMNPSPSSMKPIFSIIKGILSML